jgi:hypothetical protein
LDRITESLLNEFAGRHGIDNLPQDRMFEHFASYITVRRQYSETFETADIVLGSDGDIGIDAIAIVVNGTLVTDIDPLNELIEDSNSLDVMFIFVQADRGPSFNAAKIGNFSFAVQDFFKPTPSLPRSEAVKEAAHLMKTIYDHSSKFKRGNPAFRLYYVTTGRWASDSALEARRVAVEVDLSAIGIFRDVEVSCLGASEIQKLYAQTKNAISREFMFQNRTLAPEISGVKEAFLGFVQASAFVNIICDDDGDIVESIFYDNVRDWQGYNPVNAEIQVTLQSYDRARFALMNNGITIIAREMRYTGHRFYIEDFQIVNGCQTSHVLFNQREELDDSVMIPLRLISTQNEGVIESIIRATNRQTAVQPEQFFAVTEFAKQLELFFQSFGDARALFYERRSRQYDRLDIEKTRIITPKMMIRAFAAAFLNEPHRTTRSYKLLSGRVGTDIFAQGHRLEPYYVAAFLLYRLEYLFRNQRVEAQLKPARFHILLAARLLGNEDVLPRMNSNDMEKYCKKLTDLIWTPAAADDLITHAADAVEYIADGNFDRDNIRTQPFTEQLITHCKIISGQKKR